MLRSLAPLTIVLAMGCGLTQVKGPAPNRPANERPVCTTSQAPLKIDATIGALGALSALFGGLLLQGESDSEIPTIMIVGGITVTLSMLVSSGIGYSRVKACGKAMANYEMTHPTGPYGPPQPYPPQPYPPQPYPPQPYPHPPQPYPPQPAPQPAPAPAQ